MEALRAKFGEDAVIAGRGFALKPNTPASGKTEEG
jgi:hypothetical protein